MTLSHQKRSLPRRIDKHAAKRLRISETGLRKGNAGLRLHGGRISSGSVLVSNNFVHTPSVIGNVRFRGLFLIESCLRFRDVLIRTVKMKH